jgi:AraC-like DNA-binding protein
MRAPRIISTTAVSAEDDSFREAEAWRAVGAGWKQLHGSFGDLGFSFEWHDFETPKDLDWCRSFHPGSVEACFNLSGRGEVAFNGDIAQFESLTTGFYRHGEPGLTARRFGTESHRFITIEFHPDFLRVHLKDHARGLDPIIEGAIQRHMDSGVSGIGRLTAEAQQLIGSLRHPPVAATAQKLWYHSKALEVAALLFFHAPKDEEFFCDRQKRLAQERVSKVVALLKEHLTEPLSLEETGKRVGCSPFYLSRTFTKEMGMTLSQYQRQLRLEKAAELLLSGKFNVTEAAMEVGYSSISHFSHAFHAMYHCCPGLYSVRIGKGGGKAGTPPPGSR